MDDTGYTGPYTPARAWGCIAAVGFAAALYLPVQFTVLQFSPTRNEAALFFGAVAITFGLAVGLGFIVRLFGDWILARTHSEAHPWLWLIPVALGGVPLALALDIL